jgi:hypothetical protein
MGADPLPHATGLSESSTSSTIRRRAWRRSPWLRRGDESLDEAQRPVGSTRTRAGGDDLVGFDRSVEGDAHAERLSKA